MGVKVRHLQVVTQNVTSSCAERSEPPYRSRHSEWLRAGRPRGSNSSPRGVKKFHLSILPRPVLRPYSRA
jgi:hypothetical protein